MSQFDLAAWKAGVAAWWQAHAHNWLDQMERLSVKTTYGLLAASTLAPVLAAYSPETPVPALTALTALTASVGGNLVANMLQNAYDQAAAPKIEQEIAERPELRAEYQKLLAGVEALSAAQSALGDRWNEFEARLRGELSQLGGDLRLAAEGGIFFGDIKVEYGDLVGRDKNVYYNTTVNITSETPPTDLFRSYYRALSNACRDLRLAVVDPKFTQLAGRGEITLHEVYTDLDVLAPVRGEDEDAHAWGLRLARSEGEVRTPLLEALAAPAAARVVLLGDPGSGKSTFVNYLAHHLAAASAGDVPAVLPPAFHNLIPIRLILREVAAYLPPDACGTADMLWDALRAEVTHTLGADGAAKLLPYLRNRLLCDGGVILLDGLDEVPEAARRRQCLLEAVRKFVDCLPPTARVILTARPYAYADPVWQLPPAEFPILTLSPFSIEQMTRFVERWHLAVRPIMDWSPQEASDRGQDLAKALLERPHLGDLAARPLLLTLIATLHTVWGHLPQDRADLYEESVKLLLARWQRAREVRALDGEPERQPGLAAALGLPEATVRQALERLAYTVHERQGQAEGRDVSQADIPTGDILAVFSPLLPPNINALTVLTYLETRAGLLLGRREGVYAFLHRSFQEYLAACHLANTAKDFGRELCDLVRQDPAWWREVFLLGVGKKRQGGLGDAVNVVNILVPAAPQEIDLITDIHWRAAVLAGEALLDLKLLDQPDLQLYQRTILNRVRRWLAQLLDEGRLSPRERLAAGDVLAQLGDPRPGLTPGPSPSGRGEEEGMRAGLLWVHVPAGPFLMGSAESDEQSFPDEKPQYELTLPEYYISRYPITNAQFRPFVEGDGYANRAYWTEQGWAWREGAEADLSVWDGVKDEENWKQSYRDWLSQRPAAKRDRPWWWDDPHLGLPNRPVVGVTWFEAYAYTRWLEEQWQVASSKLPVWQKDRVESINLKPGTWNLKLPSEAEWEKAARGPSVSPLPVGEGLGVRVYPWGPEWQDDCANIKETGLEQTSPVGMFPQGASPYGVLDMAGNVWEWTRSRYGEHTVFQNDYGYPYNPDDGREEPEGMKIPVLRGGSWDYVRRIARCACRNRGNPDDFDDSLGFRVIVSLVIPEC